MLGKDKLKEKEDALQAKVNELRQLTQDGRRRCRPAGEQTREVLKIVEVHLDAVVRPRSSTWCWSVPPRRPLQRLARHHRRSWTS